MMNRIIYISFLFLISAASCFADSIPCPTRTVERYNDHIDVTYTFPDTPLTPSAYFENTSVWEVYGFGLNDIQGQPAVPFKRDFFEIPDGYGFYVSIQDSTYSVISDINFSPAYPNAPEGEDITLVPMDPTYRMFPEEVVKSENTHEYHGTNIAEIITMPLQYDKRDNTVRKYSMLKYRIRFFATITPGIRSSASPYRRNDFVSNFTYDAGHYDNGIFDYNNGIRPGDGYLIVTTNNYVPSLEKFINWKRTNGYNVYVESRDAGGWTSTDIKNVVENYYTNNDIKYLLLVGNQNEVPGKHIDSYYSDYPYGLAISNGIPKVSRGRLPVSSTQEVIDITNKIIEYETNPCMDSNFYTNGIVSSFFEDRLNGQNQKEDKAFVLTSENIREHLINTQHKNMTRIYCTEPGASPKYWNNGSYSYGEEIPAELQLPRMNWYGNGQDIISKINEGTFFLFHRDHGDTTLWHHPEFTTEDIQSLSNGKMLPVVFSIDCSTGTYIYDYDCFAEAFIKKNDGGCVAIIAADYPSRPLGNDAFSFGMIDAIWPGLQLTYRHKAYNFLTPYIYPTYKLGKVMDLGIVRMQETGNNSLNKEIYHLFGDPAMEIRTEVPQTFSAPDIEIEQDLNISTSIPCNISIYNKSQTITKVTSGNYASIGNINQDEFAVCINMHNYVPYIINGCGDNLTIQNEVHGNETLRYLGNSIALGKEVTNAKVHGEVTIDNCNINLESRKLRIEKGTKFSNSIVKFIKKD